MNIFKTKPFDIILDFIEKWYYVYLLIILTVACFNLFYNLGRVPVWSWDEARHGVNAYEMIKRNNYIVNTYAYVNDYWNLKPPVSFWAIVAGYKLVGFNPLGLRIFSAIAALITIVSIAMLTLYRNGRLASLIAASALTTTMPFIIEHCGRTGDADSIFVLFFTISMIAMCLIDKKIIWLYIAGVNFALAFLTKSWHAGSIVITGGLYLLLSKVIFRLKLKQLLFFILSCCIPILTWGSFRYEQDGLTFLKTMINYDLLARSSTALEGHVGSYSFYIEMLQRSYFYWLLILVSTVVAFALILEPNMLNRLQMNHVLALVLWVAIPFLLYTKAKTKIAWYILPILPGMAVILGESSSFLLKYKNRNLVFQLLLSFMILFSLYKNEVSIVGMVTNPGVDYAQMLLKKVGELPEYRGKNIYTLFKTGSADNPDRWDQSYLLCAELYGDFIAVEGGVEGFVNDKTDKPLFLVGKDVKTMEVIKKYKFKTVAENEGAFIFTR